MGPYHPGLTLAAIEMIFQQQHWRYRIIQNRLVTLFHSVLMVLTVDEQREILLLDVPLVPGAGMAGYVPARPDAEASAAIYMLAANYQLALGGFERDHHDGEIRFACSIPIASSMLSPSQLNAVIVVAVAAVGMHGPVINALLTGQVPLHLALAHLDGGALPPTATA